MQIIFSTDLSDIKKIGKKKHHGQDGKQNFDCNTVPPKGYKVAANFPRVNRFVFASDCRI